MKLISRFLGFFFAASALFSCQAAFAQNEYALIMGFRPGNPENGNWQEDNYNTSTFRRAFGFALREGKTLSKARFYCTTKTGTVAGSDFHATLYTHDSSTGAPSSSSTEDKTLSGTPTCPGWNEVTGFTTAITASTEYFLVVRNANADPTNNNFTLRRMPHMDFGALGGSSSGNGSGFGWNGRYSTDSGTTWAAGNGAGGFGGMRLEFSDGSFAGIPVSNVSKNTSDIAYGTREVGVVITIPSGWPTTRVRGISFYRGNTGTAPAQLRYGLRIGTGSATYTQLADDESLQNDMWLPLFFSGTAPTFTGGDTVRLTMGTPTGGSSGNGWALNSYTWDSDSNSQAMKPLSLSQTYYDGSTWTETTTSVPPFVLILEPGNEFTSSGGSYNQKIKSGFNRGFN